MSEISTADCLTLGMFPNAPANAWRDVLTEHQREAFRRVHRALGRIANETAARFPGRYQISLTSGFSETSGVRNQRPKDLWCALVNPGSDNFVRMPQLYMIASGRGVELGFAAAINRADFSDANVKSRLKAAVPTLFHLFPSPESKVVSEISDRLSATGGWAFRAKSRLALGAQEFSEFKDVIADLKSPEGIRRGSATVCRYFDPHALDDETLVLADEFAACADIFNSLMNFVGDRYAVGDDLVTMNVLLAAHEAEESAEKAGSFNPIDTIDGRRRILASITQRQGQGPFRLDLLQAYGGSCAVSGSTAIHTLEAAHIFPYSGAHTNHVTNGILLRSDIHTLFDLGLLKISTHYDIAVSDLITDPIYRRLHGQHIRLPTDPAVWPSPEALAWHVANVRREIAPGRRDDAEASVYGAYLLAAARLDLTRLDICPPHNTESSSITTMCPHGIKDGFSGPARASTGT